MKRKLIITLLALTATVTCALSFAACNNDNNDNPPATSHTHNWSQTYTEDGDEHYQTCSGCEEKNYSDHTYTDGICICGKYMPVNGTVGMNYALNENGKSYSLTGIGITKETEIIIPPDYNGLPVTKISKNAFYYCTSLTHVTIPNSVTEIGNWAFYECKLLKSINIPDGITVIGESTFNGCRSFTSIVVPNSVTTIGEKAFLACTSLTEITIPNSVTSIGISAFSSCYLLKNINFKGTVQQWDNVIKGRNWNYNVEDYTIYCTDGEIAKDGKVTMY